VSESLEIVVVDDCSIDGSRDWLKAYKSKHSLKVIFLADNAGQAKATNIGVMSCEGDYIAFLDSDDWWASEKINAFHEVLKMKSNVGLVFSSKWIVDESGHTKRLSRFDKRAFKLEDLFVKNLIGCQSAVVIDKTLYWQAGGMDENLASGKDWDLWIRVLTISRDYVYIDYPHTFYEAGSNTISSNSEKLILGRRQFWIKHLSDKQHLKSKAYFELAKLLWLRGNGTQSRRIILESLKDGPSVSSLFLFVVSLISAKSLEMVLIRFNRN
jgi:glycosyltransferase involved in cell wall biosynthesis